MNLLFLSLAYHPSAVTDTAALSRTGLQNQANNFQWAMIDGLKGNLRDGEALTVLNSLPVGVFPMQYRKLFLRSEKIGNDFLEIGALNLPYCKQAARRRAAARLIEQWACQSSDNRTVLIYSLYLPYLQAVASVREKIPGLKACVIVTDLPGGLGLASGRRGLLKRLEYGLGAKSMRLAKTLDGFILLTEQMAQPLQAAAKKHLVIEGLTSALDTPLQALSLPQDARPAVLYTGTLNRELGIDILLDAFAGMPEYQLWLCGKGDMETQVRETQRQHENIRYFGFVKQEEAAWLQSKAELLINPRTDAGAYTQYSFPSKTLEYMKAGKPVLCCKLPGIPCDYDAFLTYIEPQNASGIQTAVRAAFIRTPEERGMLGSRARAYVLKEKNHVTQAGKALAYLRSL